MDGGRFVLLSEEKIKKMIRLSDFESGSGEIDLKRARYRRKDYVRLMTLRTVAGVILAGVLVLGALVLYNVDRIRWSELVSESLFTPGRILLFSVIAIVWLIIMIVLSLSTVTRSRKEYDESMLRVDEYERTLSELMALYENESDRREEGA